MNIKRYIVSLLVIIAIVSLALASLFSSEGTIIPIPGNNEILNITDSAAMRTSLGGTFAVPGGAIIDNRVIQLGVNQEGHLNIDRGKLSSGSGTTTVGVRYMPTNADSILPECSCEGWGVADARSGVTGYTDAAFGGAVNLKVLSFTSTESEATSTVTIGSTLQVTHYYHPSSLSSNLYQVNVSITNIGADVVDLRYRRVIDWDIEPTAFNEFVTIDTGVAKNIAYTSNNGFASANPLSGHTDRGFIGTFFDAGPADQGALFDFNFGRLEVGATKTFTIYYGAAATEFEAIDAIIDVGAEAYSFGQPNTIDGNGPTLGTPNTFIMAFSGVGGTPMELPVNNKKNKFMDLKGGGHDFGNYVSEIHGMIFGDTDGDAVQDPGETDLSSVSIQLFHLISPTEEYYIQSEYTDESGSYRFTGLAPGFYKVVELPPGGSSQTFPANGQPQFVELAIREIKNGVDFGNQPVPPGNIRGIDFDDLNGNGIQDSGEEEVSGAKICISPLWSCTYTDAFGSYSFLNIPSGTYWVYEIVPAGKTATTPSWVKTIVTSDNTSTVNFANRNLIPTPDDITVHGSSDWDGDGIPEVGTGSPLNITEDLTGIGDAVSIKLTLKWSDGETRKTDMTEIGISKVWTATFLPSFPSGTARMKLEIDIAPAGPGAEDMIKIGDIIFRDPSGQIKNSCTNKPINGANALLMVEFPPTTGNFILSPSGSQIPSTNPLTTETDGKYSWMTVPGTYKVIAEAIGYITGESPAVTVPPVVTDLDIELIPVSGCGFPPQPVPELKTVVLISIGLIGLLNLTIMQRRKY